ncbi:DNA pilot protein [Peromfec virus RodF8_66]|uniref:DNA pilot protein n=1 Tax=Peromfec virus RodF8_66 TaxID=2929388 RepID=A0A976R8R3_9VIRU|nr:DNA pilot protein [Peromfec virus RodF8_66]
MSWSSGIGAGIAGAAGSTLGSLLGYSTASQNLAVSKSALNWQKEMQQKTWEREDNAVQRRVQDLIAAGLSPTLAAGSAASTSSPVKPEVPQMGTDWTKQVGDIVSQGIGVAQQVAQTQLTAASVAKTEAEKDYIAIQASRANIGKELDKAQLSLYPDRHRLLNAQIEGQHATTYLRSQQAAYSSAMRNVLNYDYQLARQLGIRHKEQFNPWSAGASVLRQIGGRDLYDRIIAPAIPQHFPDGLRGGN